MLMYEYAYIANWLSAAVAFPAHQLDTSQLLTSKMKLIIACSFVQFGILIMTVTAVSQVDGQEASKSNIYKQQNTIIIKARIQW